MGAACRHNGFFYVVGHGVDVGLQARLEALSRAVLRAARGEAGHRAWPCGGRAWRGYFPVGGELTSGRPDLKEGLYFGDRAGAEHPRVRAGTPLHGPNLFPDEPAGLARRGPRLHGALTPLGHALMAASRSSLGLDADYFADALHRATRSILFRIFNYPPTRDAATRTEPCWGVGEHTDYGVLTILRQDDAGGLAGEVAGQRLDRGAAGPEARSSATSATCSTA